MTTATAPPPTRHRLLAATPEHLGALMALYEDYARERGHRVDPEALQAFGDAAFEGMHDPDRHLLALALVGKRPVGFVAASLGESPMAQIPRALHVRVLFVVPAYRHRHRIAHDLWRAVTARAKALGVALMAQVPYEKAAVRRWQRKGGVPMAVVMVRGA